MLDPSVQRRLSVIVPAFDEEDAIAQTLRQLTEALPLAEIIAVDDGSTDSTAAKAASVPGVLVLRHPFNSGYGAALKTGMRRAGRKYLAWFDADSEHLVEDLAAIVGRLDQEGLAAVIGQRRQRSTRLVRFAGKWLLRAISRSAGVPDVADLNCGLRAFHLNIIRAYLGLLPNGFSASMTSTLIMLERGYPVAFQPITSAKRIGRSKVRLRDGTNAIVLLIRAIMLFAPLRIFLPLGTLGLIGGTAYGLGMAVTFGLGFPAAAVLVVLAGLLICILGLMADQISQLRLAVLAPTNVSDAEERDEPDLRQQE